MVCASRFSTSRRTEIGAGGEAVLMNSIRNGLKLAAELFVGLKSSESAFAGWAETILARTGADAPPESVRPE